MTKQQYKIVRDWKPGEQRVRMKNYTRTWGFVTTAYYSGIAIASGLPATSYVVRWRRDEHDAWRAIELSEGHGVTAARGLLAIEKLALLRTTSVLQGSRP